uniref:Uncharacterized protein n=1 Tax=Anguilla anguilla TaxID=7936 RepID=A0A0E9QZT0_ANGAN
MFETKRARLVFLDTMNFNLCTVPNGDPSPRMEVPAIGNSFGETVHHESSFDYLPHAYPQVTCCAVSNLNQNQYLHSVTRPCASSLALCLTFYAPGHSDIDLLGLGLRYGKHRGPENVSRV